MVGYGTSYLIDRGCQAVTGKRSPTHQRRGYRNENNLAGYYVHGHNALLLFFPLD